MNQHTRLLYINYTFERRWELVRKRTKRCIAAAVDIAVAAALVKGTRDSWKKMADMAMNRELTEEDERLIRSVGNPKSLKEKEMEEKRNAAAEQLRNSECSTVMIHSYDGSRLTGHLCRAENPKRNVIAVHGWRASWDKDFGVIADFLYSNGCNVLYIEQRAHGESDGSYIGFGMLERYDVQKWIDWINMQGISDLPVYLFGMSMGAATVLMTAGEEHLDHVHGVIADSGYTSPRDEWKYVAESNLHYSYKLMEKYMNKAAKERIGYLPDEYSSTAAMQKCKIPVLFIHGTDDRIVPVEMSYENYKECAAPRRLLIVPGAGHCQSCLAERERYEKELLQFWQDFDYSKKANGN